MNIVENYSSGPNVMQRKALSDVVGSEDARCAILTDSKMERNALVAMAWLGLSLRGFHHGQHAEAAASLGLTAPELRLVLEVLPGMRKECGMHFAPG